MPPPSCETPDDESTTKPDLLVALVCASVVASYDRTWLSRPVVQLIPPGGPRPDRLSRLKACVLAPLAALVAAATRRGRPTKVVAVDTARAALSSALLALATGLLAESRVPLRRRAVQERLVAAYDRLHAEHGLAVRDFCGALDLSERTFHAWRVRPPAPPPPPPAETAPPPRRRRDRATGRFALEVTAPGTQLGADTTDVTVLGVDLKLVGAQDLGAREQRLWEAFSLDEHEKAKLVSQTIAAATDGREGFQLITDQGTPYLAEAARAAYDALGVEHAPQKEGAPTEKATVERAFLTVKDALAPLLDFTNRLAAAVPALRRADLAKPIGTLLIAVFLRVYAAGRRHLGHPLDGHDPEALRAIVEQQREHARAEDRSVRLFLEAVHAEYAMPGSAEAFVRTFRRYPLEDLHEAERRFRDYACRCVARVCDRYFAAIVRDVHERGRERRAAERAAARAASDARHAARAAAERARHLDMHPELRLHEGLDLLADSWQPHATRFLADGQPACAWLRIAAAGIYQQRGAGAPDEVERQFRAWLTGRPNLQHSARQAVRWCLATVITDVQARHSGANGADFVGAICRSAPKPAAFGAV